MKDNHMKYNDLALMNFRIPRSTKHRFKTVCRERNQMMTSVLNQLVIDFINDDDNHTRFEQPLPLGIFPDD